MRQDKKHEQGLLSNQRRPARSRTPLSLNVSVEKTFFRFFFPIIKGKVITI